MDRAIARLHDRELAALRVKLQLRDDDIDALKKQLRIKETVHYAPDLVEIAELRDKVGMLNTELHDAVVALLDAIGKPGARPDSPRSVLYDGIIPEVRDLRVEVERLRSEVDFSEAYIELQDTLARTRERLALAEDAATTTAPGRLWLAQEKKHQVKSAHLRARCERLEGALRQAEADMDSLGWPEDCSYRVNARAALKGGDGEE